MLNWGRMPEKSRPGVLSSTHNRPVESLNVLDLLRVGQASEVEEQGAASACAPRMYATYEICASEALAPAARSSRAPRPRRQGAAPSAPARDVNGQENRKDQWISVDSASMLQRNQPIRASSSAAVRNLYIIPDQNGQFKNHRSTPSASRQRTDEVGLPWGTI